MAAAHTVGKPPAYNLPELHILPVPGAGPEDALFVDDAIYTGLEDGRIVKVSLDGWQIEVVADTQGRPLGLEQHPQGCSSAMRRRVCCCSGPTA